SKYWLQQYLFNSRDEDLKKVESTRHSDIVVLGTQQAADHFQQLLRYYQLPDLCQRLRAIPYPVDETFCAQVVTAKSNRIVGIARWDSAQKDAGLAARAIQICLEQGGRSEFVLIGRGGEPWFKGLERRFPQVRYIGVRPPVEVASILAQSRSILLSS